MTMRPSDEMACPRWLMRSACLLFIVTTLTCASTALADECDAIAAHVAAEVPGSTSERRSSSNVFLKHGDAESFQITCIPEPPGLFISWQGAHPPVTFFDLVAKAGSVVVAAPARTVRAGATACHQEALTSAGGMVRNVFEGVWFECHAFDGGTRISIYRK
jgi:hypothetical protein